MGKYIFTLHSKMRFHERVSADLNIKEEVMKAKMHGVRLVDIPLVYKKERKFLGSNKIVYNEKVYVFFDSKFKKLITIYGNRYPILDELYIAKENIRQNYSVSKPGVIFCQFFLSVENYTFNVLLYNSKIIKFEIVNEIRYEYLKLNSKKIINLFYDLIKKYFSGEVICLKDLIDISFCDTLEKQIYSEVLKVPYGETITYKQLFCKLKKQISYKKISSVLNKCPIVIIIPTHRIVRSNGQVGSFKYHRSLKKMFLRLEKENKNKIENFISEKFTYKIGDLFERGWLF